MVFIRVERINRWLENHYPGMWVEEQPESEWGYTGKSRHPSSGPRKYVMQTRGEGGTRWYGSTPLKAWQAMFGADEIPEGINDCDRR